ncbi:ABC transporter permease [Serinicoccus kebangsaanensis]|uniref:ABC transporter permease n=1 Tax=Serinicoccus kebangsaanensis TaxID=2602069 RepID=UPI00124E3D7B|nr:ABC-2 family transporter protein [Serinicoccus kebangsaanensis]
MAEAGTLRGDLTAYRAVLSSRVRAQRAYAASFRLDLVGAALITVVEFAEVWVLFGQVDAIGGLTLASVMLVFGLAEMTFSTADLLVGHCDRMPTYVRAGTLDVFYLRPQPVLAQLMTSDIDLRRVARVAGGMVILVVGLVVSGVRWTPEKVALLAVTIPAAVAIYAGLFIAAAGVQFFLINGAETTNAFVYGGRYAASQPASVWPRSLVLVFGLIFPVAFTGYLPALALLDLPVPFGLPGWTAWLTPVAAVWSWLVALGCWRLGTRHYQGAGG